MERSEMRWNGKRIIIWEHEVTYWACVQRSFHFFAYFLMFADLKSGSVWLFLFIVLLLLSGGKDIVREKANRYDKSSIVYWFSNWYTNAEHQCTRYDESWSHSSGFIVAMKWLIQFFLFNAYKLSDFSVASELKAAVEFWRDFHAMKLWKISQKIYKKGFIVCTCLQWTIFHFVIAIKISICLS